MNLELKDVGVMAWTALVLIIGLIIGAVGQSKIDEGVISFSQGKYSIEAQNFCVSQEYAHADSANLIVGKYFIISCSRIKDYGYEVRRFALYPDELNSFLSERK